MCIDGDIWLWHSVARFLSPVELARLSATAKVMHQILDELGVLIKTTIAYGGSKAHITAVSLTNEWMKTS